MKLFNNPIFYFLVLLLLVIGLYWQTTAFEFVLDDTMVIKENSFVQKGTAGISEILGNDSMTGFLGKKPDLLAGGRYRPLSLVVFALGYEVFGLNAYYYHLLNIIFYLLCCFTLFYTLATLFQTNENQKSQLAVFAATVIFAAHPTHTEAVANVKGLDEILAFLFGFLAFLCTILYYDKKKIGYIIVAIVSFLLGLLSKESTLPLLVAIPISLYFFREASLKEVFKYTAILFVPTIIYLAIRNNALGYILNNQVNTTGIMNDPYFIASSSQKIGTIIFTLLLYIKLLFFPHPLTHDYYPFHIEYHEIYHPLSIVAILVISFLFWIAIKGIKPRNKLAFIIFFFFVTISIVSNVAINVGAFMNERFLFIPSFALSMFIIYALDKLSKSSRNKILTYSILVIFFVGFIYKSYSRIPVWENERKLNISAVEVSKNSARSNCFYGVSLYKELSNDSIAEVKMVKTKEAQKYINRSLEIYPEYADALRMKAGLAAEIYKVDNNAEVLLDEFIAILNVRHIAFVDEFTNWMERRVDKNTMANYYYKAGYETFAVKNRNFNLASNYLQKGVKVAPTNAGILFGSCVVSYLTKNYIETIKYGNSYINLHGANAEMYFYLGNAQIKSGNPQIGKQNLAKAYQLNPELKNKQTN